MSSQNVAQRGRRHRERPALWSPGQA